MNAAETLTQYERQLAALDRMERILGRMTAAADQMAGAVQRAADRMGELLASTQKTAAQSVNLKAPFDSAAQSIAGKVGEGLEGLKNSLNPQALALSLALSLGWKLFGDDIMSVLNPAMTVLESFAGLVHSTLGALAPFFTPVVWAVELLAQGIDWMAAKMNTLMPIVLGLTAAMAIFHKATIASAMATKIHAAGTVLHTVVTKAHTVATNGLKLAQAALDMVLSTSPLGLIARLAGVAVGIFAAWTMRVGGLKNAIGILFNGIIGGINWVLELLNKIPGVNIPMIASLEIEKGPAAQAEAEATTTAALGAAESPVFPTPEDPYAAVIPPDLANKNAPLDYGAMLAEQSPLSYGMDNYVTARWGEDAATGAFSNGYQTLADSLKLVETVERVQAVELLESEVSLSEEDREALLGAITQRPVSKVLNLSPTVHLTAYVRSEPDLYQLKNMIEQVLEEEICACAEGEHL